jgi:hypothetical protein
VEEDDDDGGCLHLDLFTAAASPRGEGVERSVEEEDNDEDHRRLDLSAAPPSIERRGTRGGRARG